jgi:hypothetical protein
MIGNDCRLGKNHVSSHEISKLRNEVKVNWLHEGYELTFEKVGP